MSIHSDRQQTQEDANHSIHEQETIVQPMSPPMQPPPQPPARPPRGKRERGFIVSALLIVLVLVLALGSVLVVQLARCPATQPTPVPTAATTSTPAPTVATTPTPSAGPYQLIDALWMSDATTGWARTTTHLILHTSDGGKSWQDVTPPYPAGSTVQVPPAFASLNGNVAWVAVFEKQQPDGTVPNVVFRTSAAFVKYSNKTDWLL